MTENSKVKTFEEQFEELKSNMFGELESTVKEKAFDILEDALEKVEFESPALNFLREQNYDTYYVSTEAYSAGVDEHCETGRISAMTQAGLHCWLHGQAGTGKTTIAQNVSTKLGLDFYPMQKVTDEFTQLIGFRDGTGKYQATNLYKAMKNGGLLFIDEIDASSPEALIVINTVLANNFMTFPSSADGGDETVYAHEDFKVIVAGNTLGKGGDMNYTGRNKIDAATLDRFVPIHVDYDKKLELIISNRDNDLIQFIHRCREVIEANMINHVISYRAMSQYKKLEGFGEGFVFENVLFKALAWADVSSIRKGLESKHASSLVGNEVWNNFRDWVTSQDNKK
ncbi:putative phage-encoded porphyrin biosynthetic protein, CobS [Listeria phage LP-013]|uniref:Putative phage-encoded porphyrin biosynthetic protein, CobS n=1 Tax=Listeria phage LP-013 TaxID=2590047 RepID=A0A514U6R9_9CAUD|nr:putative phage-encoded porphyrin biosynthetic protein, CobS [Listeria phage LP-013]